MIAYLIKFILCSALLLAAYLLLLKNKSMFRFNRFYLLAAVVISLSAPLIVLRQAAVPILTTYTEKSNAIIAPTAGPGLHFNINPVPTNPFDYGKHISCTCIFTYVIVSGLLIWRFFKNIWSLYSNIKRGETINYRGKTLVLIDEKLTPHTFLKYIFLNAGDYRTGRIESDVLQHEFSHARQRHSLDIIFLELVQAFCWFNPVLILYRKAAHLNHEFLADEAVLAVNGDVGSYQTLLLSKIQQLQGLHLASQLNYAVTKYRLLMMTKKTKPLSAWLSRLAVLPVLAFSVMLFTGKTDAQQLADNAPKAKLKLSKTDTTVYSELISKFPKSKQEAYPSTKEGASETLINEYKAITAKYQKEDRYYLKNPARINGADKLRLQEIFKQMSRDQQNRQVIGFSYPVPAFSVIVPTKTQLDTWKDPKGYGVWIDEKHVANSRLENYRPPDFDMVFVSRLTKTAINHKNYHYQVDLMTVNYYKQYVKEAYAGRHRSMIVYRYADRQVTKSKG